MIVIVITIVVETRLIVALRRAERRSFGEIMRWFKGKCTFLIHRSHINFKWQPRFYDHVVRDQNDLERIRHYIQTNPERWCRDRNNSANEFKFHD